MQATRGIVQRGVPEETLIAKHIEKSTMQTPVIDPATVVPLLLTTEKCLFK